MSATWMTAASRSTPIPSSVQCVLIALNRKNSLFAGHDRGAKNWAIVASFIETCKLNSVNPHAWLPNAPSKLVMAGGGWRIVEVLPWATPPSPRPSPARGEGEQDVPVQRRSAPKRLHFCDPGCIKSGYAPGGDGQVFWRGQSVTAVRPLKNTQKTPRRSVVSAIVASS